MTQRLSFRFLALLFAGILATSLSALSIAPTCAHAASDADASNAIVILHSNDVHCAGLATNARAIGYAGIAQAAADARATAGADHVTLVDAGDAIQGQPIGTLSTGGDLVDLMNAAGYDVAIPGNHEFDYGIPRLTQLASQQADYPYVTCNVVNTETGDALFAPYRMFDYSIGGATVTVAYVGITTPTTLSSESPTIFQNAAGEIVWSFYEDETGTALYQQVQATVDAAHAAGADYVIAVAHLGKDASSTVPERYTSTAVIAHTTGIDAVIDGHTHEVYNTTAPNADGEQIPLSQCGTQFQAYGTLTITPDGDPGPEDVASSVTVAADLAAPVAQNPSVADAVAAAQASVEAELGQTVGTSLFGLSVYAPDANGNPWWWVARMRETNLGDYVADAYRALLDADVALINGGGIRAPQTAVAPMSDGTFGFGAGPLTYSDFVSINSFGNTLSLVEVTGQDLLDALEYSVRKLTPAFDDATESTGSFLQVSGLTFTARVDIPSPVVENESGGFASVNPTMARRVSDVSVGGAPLDAEKTYTLATIPLILSGSGDYTMFGDCTYLKPDAGLDYEALVSYLRDDLGGTIGHAYADPAGEGRITLLTGETPAAETVTVYRLFNPDYYGMHLWTSDVNEVQTLSGLDWNDEGPRFTEYAAGVADGATVYRLYNANNGDHFFTASAAEADGLVGLGTGWRSEGIAWYAPTESATPVYRLYNPTMTADGGIGNHLWTRLENERDVLCTRGWQYEGIGWYAVAPA